MTKFEVTVLGSSSALPTSERYPTAHVLNVHERFFLIDCGEGTQIQIRRNRIRFLKINHIFISHLHGDHYFGLIGLISTFALLGRKNDLHIYCHSELPNMLKSQIDFLNDDSCYKIIWHPLNFKKAAIILSDDDITVTSFPLNHRIACCGFRFEEKESERKMIKEKIKEYNIPLCEIPKIKRGENFITNEGLVISNEELTIPPRLPRSYAFCTDTLFNPQIVEQIKNVNLLYHEATYEKGLIDQAKATYHCTSEQAATIAAMANAKQLVIGHFSARYFSCDNLLKEAQSIFPNTELAKEGKKFSIE